MQKIVLGYFLCARQHAAVVLVCRWGSVGFGVNEDSLDGPDESWRVSRHYLGDCCISGGCSKGNNPEDLHKRQLSTNVEIGNWGHWEPAKVLSR